MSGLTLVTAPQVRPITLTEAKKHLRVDHTEEDDLIDTYIRAATDFCDGFHGFLGRALVTQTWRLTIDEFPTAEIKIPLPPLQSVSSIKYDDGAGVEQTIDPTEYYVDAASEPGWVTPNTSWPTPLDALNAVRIEFVAGYAPTTDSPPDLVANIPYNIKAGIKLILGNLYENREDNVVGTVVNRVPNGAEYLLRRHKFDLSMA
jgi:uncharacterized phiE125 gp8 family phage protein